MVVSEIFSSIDGESKRAGELVTFVRAVGCNLRCAYCDSKYTWAMDKDCKTMSVEEIVEECKRLGNTNITFTGGEPLIQKDADELIIALAENGFNVGIETNGAIDYTTRPWFVDNIPNVWLCIDYKGIASGEMDKMLPLDKFAQLRDYDVIKFVVGSKEDLDLAHDVIKYLRGNECVCYVYLSPVFGMIEPVDIVNYMLENRLQYKIRFQLQLHKFVWDPNLRGV